MKSILIHGLKKKTFDKTRHLKNNDKFKKYFIPAEKNIRYNDTILSKSNRKTTKLSSANFHV